MLRQLHNSKSMKEKNNWSMNTGKGFTKEEIKSIESNNKHLIITTDAFWSSVELSELNLSETIECIKFLEEQFRNECIQKIKDSVKTDTLHIRSLSKN